MKVARLVAKALVVMLPWVIRRKVLIAFYRYEIEPGARIAPCSWIFPEFLSMKANSQIASFCVAIHLGRVEMGRESRIGRGNWITGHPTHSTRHFAHRSDRDSALLLGDHAAITKSHLIDCTDRISIGAFTTIAGYASQFITHGIDAVSCRQDCSPIEIGSHCLVGSRVICLGGSALPDQSILGAGSTLNKRHTEPLCLYVGSPAKLAKRLSSDYLYFSRNTGFVS